MGYMQFSFVFFACLVVASAALALAANARDRRKNQELLMDSRITRTRSTIDRDKEHALRTIGDDSVYKFFLGESWMGWTIVLLVVVAQIWLLSIFVAGAEIDWTKDKVDFVYTWKCPRDQVECTNTNDLGPKGWLAFTILMIAFLLKDIINGTKLIMLSAKERRSRNERIRFFIGGTLLTSVAVFTFYVSAIYNRAIATNNREIIENSVIILFILDVDEMLYGILMAINPDWAESMFGQKKHECPVADAAAAAEKKERARKKRVDEEAGLQHEADPREADQTKQDHSETIESLEGELLGLKTKVATLQETVKQLNAHLNQFLKTPQDEPSNEQDESKSEKCSVECTR